jgi:uncharacterized protein YdaU (DUF1376 family)
MALRDQPFLPLYVKDFISDSKLRRCSSESVGVYIMLMCNLHKEEEYGVLTLTEEDKKSKSANENFAEVISLIVPFKIDVVSRAIKELLQRKVLHIEGDSLIQKRMKKDGILSDLRSKAGKKGGKKTQQKVKEIAKAKTKQKPDPEEADEQVTNFPEDVQVKVDKLEMDIREEFKYTSIQYFRQHVAIRDFVNTLPGKNLLDVFIKQFSDYRELKLLDKYPIGFNNFFGKQSEQWDGRWNENWTEQLKIYKSRKNNNEQLNQGSRNSRANSVPNPGRKLSKL